MKLNFRWIGVAAAAGVGVLGITAWVRSRAPIVPRPEANRPAVTAFAAGAAAERTGATPTAAPAAGAHVAAIAAFDAWLTRERASASGHVTPGAVAEGVALAQARRAALKELIRIDPREALAHAVPTATRRALPAEIIAQLEQPVDAYGDLEVIDVCGKQTATVDRWTTIGGRTYATFTYGRRLGTLSKNHLPVHGIAVDNVLALSELPFRALDADETAAVGVGGAGRVTVAVGDAPQAFASTAALDRWTQAQEKAEQQPNPDNLVTREETAALAAGWTTGAKTVLWIRAEFTDDPGAVVTDDQINAAMAGADTLYQDISHGTCSLVTTIVPGTLKLPSPKSYYEQDPSTYTTLRSTALQLARDYDAANGGTGKYNPDKYDRYIVVFKDVNAYSWAGMGTVGNKGVCLNGTCAGAVAAHELGHNQGLRHSHAWAPSAGSAIASGGTHMEYGDAFDDMGSGQSGNIGGHFNAPQKYNLGYLTDASVQTVTQSGTYRIYRHDDRNASGIQALKIATKWTTTNYWFEYRHAAPYPTWATPNAGNLELPRLQNGVVAHWDKAPPVATGPGTYLLDMTPTTTNGVSAPADPGDISHLLDDAALALGETFTDSDVGLTLTPVNVGGTAPNEWIEVRVSIDTGTGNKAPAAPALTGPAQATARTATTWTASSSDPNADTVYYHWDFGDGSIVPTTGSVTHEWLRGGTYTVQCTALDGRGGSTTSSATVTVADPLLSWQRRAATLTAHYFYDVIFDGTKFVAIGSFVGATSTDGITWTAATGMTSRNYNYAVAFGGGRYVAVGSAGTGVMNASICQSADGLAWTDEYPSTDLPELLDVGYAAGRFVAVGDSGTIISSADGVTWTRATTGTTANLKVVRYGGGRWVAAGTNATLLTSTDGLTWQNVSGFDTATIYALVYFQNTWVAVTSSYPLADPSKRAGWVSTNGTTWTRLYLDLSSSITGPIPVANSSLLLGVSRVLDGKVFFAENPLGVWADAQVMPAPPLGSAMALTAAAEGNGTIVVVGQTGQIYTPSGQPFLLAQPTGKTVNAGETATFTAQAYGTGPYTYQWKKDGVVISGATGATFTVANAGTINAGNYTVTIYNASGSVTSQVATLVVNAPAPSDVGRLTNLSIRATAGAGDQTLIAGVTVTGGGTSTGKVLLVRAVGPTLATYGVPGALVDPVLSVFRLGEGTALATNDGWRGDEQVRTTGASVGAFPLSTTSADAALCNQFGTGGYTMQVAGRSGSGVALVEVYDATAPAAFTATSPRLSNISARTQVSTGDNVLIVGFTIGGSTSRRVLIRAAGPTLAKYGVSGVLLDPKLELYRQEGSTSVKLSENDNWNDSADVVAAASSVGGFPLQSGSKDAALIAELQPGSYSVIVRGVADTTGVALAEVYELP